ncbi:pentatricopeptide repeat-containing protein At4g13650-like [Phalaenopsis equestris]|uniref:pentatricopeptide repeat-containing protein At4g13650-like n=1 Tax=Phalaenopsis equestris TaxID=78828 RepID=UPI0009E459CB|nr:pentatricopeptide repeat-containing protein At4g13650-like [Phalaenopsis equestris]
MLKELTILTQLIQTYARNGKLQKGKQLHAHLLTSTGIPSTFIANHLLNMYAKCGDLTHALNMFDSMPQPNLVTWTAMITGFSHNARFLDSLLTFYNMRASGIQPTEFAFSSAIQAATALGSLAVGMRLHSLSLKLSYNTELFVGSNLADMYSKCDSLAFACRIFEELPEKDEVSWTAMIVGYAKNGDFDKALVAFHSILENETLAADQHVFCSALSACAGLKAGQLGRSIHARVVKSGFSTENIVNNSLTDMYSKNGDMESAATVVDTSSNGWNVVSCSSLIDGYVEVDRIEEAITTYVESKRRGIYPNEFTFSSLIKACANDAALDQGIQLHAQVIKTSFFLDSFVCAVLVDMYGKCGLLSSSYQIFEETQNPTNITWNSIINVFAQHGCGQDAIEAFHQMVARHIEPNHITFIILLMACSHSGLVEQGLEFFGSMNETFGIEPRDEHYSCVIDMLGRAGKLREAEEFIHKMPCKPNAHAWCSLLGACRTYGRKELGELAAEKLMKLEPENSGTHVLLSTIYAGVGQWEDVKAVRRLMKDNGRKKLPGLSWTEVEQKTHVFGAEDWSHPRKDEIYKKMEELWVRIREEGYVPYTAAVVSKVEESEKERLLRHHSERIAVAFALISSPVGKPVIVKKNLRVCVDCHSAIKLIAKVEERVIIVRDSARFHHFRDGSCSCRDYW